MAYLGTSGSTAEVQEEEMNKKRGASMLEAGWYRCALVEDEAKPYGWGTGLSMQFQILDGDYKERRVFDFLCVEHNKSPQAQHIARVKLAEFAAACGHRGDVEDTGPLYNKPVMVEVYRAKEENSDYAEDDGKKPRIGQFLSVEQWRAKHAGEPTPGMGKGPKSVPAPVPTNSPGAVPAAAYDESEVPF